MSSISDILVPNCEIRNIPNINIISEIMAVGPWDGSGGVQNPSLDIVNAGRIFQTGERTLYLLMNMQTSRYLNSYDSSRIPLYERVLSCFGIAPFPHDIRPNSRYERLYNAIRWHIIRTSLVIKTNKVLVVSDRNNAVLIHV
jgi:hypothetical protein